MTAMNKLAKHAVFQNIYELNAATLCEKRNKEFNDMRCIQRLCEKCGTNKLDKVNELAVMKDHKGPAEWKKWTRVSKEENGKKTSKMVLMRKEGTVEELVEELKMEAEGLSQHLFTANWQSREFLQISKSPPHGSAVMVMDFAENYGCRYQDEVQAVHWGHDSATIHPIVAYYKCPECTATVTDSLIMITQDNVHDYHAVRQFSALAVDHIKEKGENINRIICFSDGAGCQYKSRGPFLDISYGKLDFNLSAFQHEYFGSRHGKGPSDGESGVIKRLATDAVMSGSEIISNAKELYNFVKQTATRPDEQEANSSECQHFRRKAFWIEEIDRCCERQALKTVEGTRQFHSILSVEPNVIQVRELSCFCEGCEEGKEACSNRDYVHPYVTKRISATKPAGRQESAEQVAFSTEGPGKEDPTTVDPVTEESSAASNVEPSGTQVDYKGKKFL